MLDHLARGDRAELQRVRERPSLRVAVEESAGEQVAGAGRVDHVRHRFGGNFDKLALWSESSAGHSIGGQASLSLDGVFFTPNATMTFTGQGSFDQVRAQFIANKLVMSGQGELIMQPDPSRVVLIPIVGARLIR